MVGNEVVIRRAEPADAAFIAGAVAAVSERVSDKTAGDAERLKKDIFGKTPKAEVIIAEAEGQVVGMALYAAT